MYNFNAEQINFIKIQMENTIKKCKESIKKYGYYDEANVGADVFIEIAESVLKELGKEDK